MPQPTNIIALYPPGTEDRLSYAQRAAAGFRLIGLAPDEVEQAVARDVAEQEAAVGRGFLARVRTPAGVAAYAPTRALRKHLAAGGEYPAPRRAE